ncbi:MAG: helix-turn-helix domain-containing protein, partial [Rickettsiales bacterium]|nr:helix-turn-helix domain-containing protein [Rickettsiales bacterium]
MEQENKLQPNYYAIIPANIRYDKNLNSTEKLLYAEITALCDKEGYCWASNNYFAEILNKLPAYVSQVLTKLSKKEYITVEIEKNNKGTFRKIYIGKIIGKIYTEKESKIIKKENKTTENSIEGYIEKTIEGVQKKLYGGIEKTIEGYRNNYIQKN